MCRGIDFEGDLVKMYLELRTMMSKKQEHADFSLTGHHDPAHKRKVNISLTSTVFYILLTFSFDYLKLY